MFAASYGLLNINTIAWPLRTSPPPIWPPRRHVALLGCYSALSILRLTGGATPLQTHLQPEVKKTTTKKKTKAVAGGKLLFDVKTRLKKVYPTFFFFICEGARKVGHRDNVQLFDELNNYVFVSFSKLDTQCLMLITDSYFADLNQVKRKWLIYVR